jgi:hypothetical protein
MKTVSIYLINAPGLITLQKGLLCFVLSATNILARKSIVWMKDIEITTK